MSIKVYIKNGKIIKYDHIEYDKEVIIDAHITDNIVIDEKTWEVVKYENSSQYVWVDIKEMFNQYKYFVNITDWKWEIHKEYVEWMEYDEYRWDMFFNTIEEAEEYAKLFNNK